METIFKISQVVSLRQINDIITTALEGGSNYWYEFREEATEMVRKYKGKYVPEIHGDSSTLFYGTFSEAVLVAVMNDEKIPVHDVEGDEDDELIGILDKANIQAGIEKMLKDNRPEIKILVNPDSDYDANDADVIFQYLCLGELVYG